MSDPNPILTRKTQLTQEAIMVNRMPYIRHMARSERMGVRLVTVLHNVAIKKLMTESEKK